MIQNTSPLNRSRGDSKETACLFQKKRILNEQIKAMKKTEIEQLQKATAIDMSHYIRFNDLIVYQGLIYCSLSCLIQYFFDSNMKLAEIQKISELRL